MSRSRGPHSDDRSYPRRVASLRKTHEEARAVLDHQIQILGDIDEKAARTVRITALLLGAVLSAPSLLDDPTPFINRATKWGGVSLVLSLVIGTLTYSVSSPDLGPGPNDIDRLLDGPFREDQWLVIVLTSYEDWIDRTDWLNQFNGAYLALSQASLAVGIFLLAIGVLDGLETSIRLLSVSVYSIPVQLIATLSLGFLLLRSTKFALR